MISSRRIAAFEAVFLLVAGLVSACPAFAQLHCEPYWTAAYKCMEHCGPCPNAGPVGPSPAEIQRQQEMAKAAREEAARKEAERLAAEKQARAEAADRAGVEAGNRGDWATAADKFMEALEDAPDSAEIRAHLDQAKIALENQTTSTEIAELRQRIENAITAANLDVVRERTENKITVERLNQMYDNMQPGLTSQPAVRAGGMDGLTNRVAFVYPVLLHPVTPNSPPARVLAASQPKIKEIDAEIRGAQEALRRLIASNGLDEEERAHWTEESEKATVDAKDLSLSLLIDLIGAHVDGLAEANREKRELVLDRLLKEADGNGPSKRIVSGYLSLVSTKKDLDRLQQEVRLAGKDNELRVRIRDFSMHEDTEFTRETFWDVVSQIGKVEELAGPSKDLLDAAYTIYRQAASFQRLSATEANNEKTLQAAASLGRYIVRLEARKQAAKAETAHQVVH